MSSASQRLEGAKIAKEVVEALLNKALKGESNSFMEVRIPPLKDKYHPPVYPEWIIVTTSTLQVSGVQMEAVTKFTPEINRANVEHLKKMLQVAEQTIQEAELAVQENEQKQRDNLIKMFKQIGAI